MCPRNEPQFGRVVERSVFFLFKKMVHDDVNASVRIELMKIHGGLVHDSLGSHNETIYSLEMRRETGKKRVLFEKHSIFATTSKVHKKDFWFLKTDVCFSFFFASAFIANLRFVSNHGAQSIVISCLKD